MMRERRAGGVGGASASGSVPSQNAIAHARTPANHDIGRTHRAIGEGGTAQLLRRGPHDTQQHGPVSVPRHALLWGRVILLADALARRRAAAGHLLDLSRRRLDRRQRLAPITHIGRDPPATSIYRAPTFLRFQRATTCIRCAIRLLLVRSLLSEILILLN
jgi:hypothetical protein